MKRTKITKINDNQLHANMDIQMSIKLIAKIQIWI